MADGNSARGCVFGLLISAPLWVVVAYLVWRAL